MLDIFPQNNISVTYKRNKNLREILSPSLFPRTTKQNECSIEECNRKRDICKNFLVVFLTLLALLPSRSIKLRGF